MEQYIKIDSIVEDMTAQDLAGYLINNHREYAVDLAYRIEMELVIESREKEQTDAKQD